MTETPAIRLYEMLVPRVDEGRCVRALTECEELLGSAWVLLVNAAVRSDAVESGIASTGLGITAFQIFFFAGFSFLAAIAFGV